MDSSTKQHYLPAAYIGNFSNDETKEGRKRLVWVYRKVSDNIYSQITENIAAKKGMYPKVIDDSWTYVEKKLQESIKQLITKDQMEASCWITMVRFISQLFIRPPEFSIRFKQRFSTLGDKIQEFINGDSSDYARIFEMQRLYAPIMYSDWKVIHNTSKTPFITNDIGYTLTKDISGKLGYTIPLNKYSALLITKSVYDREWLVPIAYDEFKKNWLISGIKHVYCNEKDVLSLNNALLNSSIYEIYCASKYFITMLKKNCTNLYNNTSIGPGALIENSNYLRKHTMDLFNVMSIIAKPPDDSINKLIKEFKTE